MRTFHVQDKYTIPSYYESRGECVGSLLEMHNTYLMDPTYVHTKYTYYEWDMKRKQSLYYIESGKYSYCMS